MTKLSTSFWYIAYALNDEEFTGSILSITDGGGPKHPDYTWVKRVEAADELGAYLEFVKWFDTAHVFHKLKTEGANGG